MTHEFHLPYRQSDIQPVSSEEKLDLLNATWVRAYPIAEKPGFDDLLSAIDRAVDHRDDELEAGRQ